MYSTIALRFLLIVLGMQIGMATVFAQAVQLPTTTGSYSSENRYVTGTRPGVVWVPNGIYYGPYYSGYIPPYYLSPYSITPSFNYNDAALGFGFQTTAPVYYSPMYSMPAFYSYPYTPLPNNELNSVVSSMSYRPNNAGYIPNRRPKKNSLANSQNQPDDGGVARGVEWIDDLVRQGAIEEALYACDRLIKSRETLPTGLYLRAGLLATAEAKSVEEIDAYFDLARQAGSPFDPRVLPGGSMRGYFRPRTAEAIDKHSLKILKDALNKPKPYTSYRTLATIATLDGQLRQAEKFADLATPDQEVPAGRK